MKVAQSCPTLWDPMDYRVHGILQARILEWVAVPFSRVSSQSRDQTQVCRIAGGFFTSWASREALIYVKNLADVQAPGQQVLCISYCPHLYHLHFHHSNTFFFFFWARIPKVWSLYQQWASPGKENYLASLNQKFWGETQVIWLFEPGYLDAS